LSRGYLVRSFSDKNVGKTFEKLEPQQLTSFFLQSKSFESTVVKALKEIEAKHQIKEEE
jgi:hypothetical protein